PRGGLFDELPKAIRYYAKSKDGIANLRLFCRYFAIQNVSWDSLVIDRLGPTTVLEIAGQRNQEHADLLRQILSETRIAVKINKKLIRGGGAGVNDHERRQIRQRLIRRELQASDVPVKAIGFVSDHLPLRSVSEFVGGNTFEFARVKGPSGCCISQRLHR